MAYVYDLQSVADAARRMLAMRSVDRIFYAMKANSHPDVLGVLLDAGIDVECVSPGEVHRVLEARPDLDTARILFTPNFAPRADYAWALERDLLVTLDNLYPLKHWPELFTDREIIVRVDPGHGRGHHDHVKTGGTHSKFGVPLFELDELRALTTAARARVVGLHAHSGSGIFAHGNWREVGWTLVEAGAAFPELRYVDVGGGLGIPEKPEEQALDLAAVDDALAEIKQAHPNLEVWLEPGRYLVAQAGVLLCRVTQTKGKGDVRYVGLNTGMNSLIRPALYGAYHEIINLTRIDEDGLELVNVVGPNCESGDRLGSDRLLPASREGDVILIANAGAYGQVMSSHYNLREPAREIVLA